MKATLNRDRRVRCSRPSRTVQSFTHRHTTISTIENDLGLDHNLSRRLIRAQEEEYARIARELHDDLNQQLAMLAIELDQACQQPGMSVSEARKLMRSLAYKTQDLASDVHRLARRLHPSSLESLGLVAATKNLCQAVSKQHGIEVVFAHRDVPKSIGGDVALCLYRIVQEALGNVVKHSGAASVQVELTANRFEVFLWVLDSGEGFDPDSPQNRAGMGLVSMRERVRTVGGKFSVRSQVSQGTSIEVRIPSSLCPQRGYRNGSSSKQII